MRPITTAAQPTAATLPIHTRTHAAAPARKKGLLGRARGTLSSMMRSAPASEKTEKPAPLSLAAPPAAIVQAVEGKAAATEAAAPAPTQPQLWFGREGGRELLENERELAADDAPKRREVREAPVKYGEPLDAFFAPEDEAPLLHPLRGGAAAPPKRRMMSKFFRGGSKKRKLTYKNRIKKARLSLKKSKKKASKRRKITYKNIKQLGRKKSKKSLKKRR